MTLRKSNLQYTQIFVDVFSSFNHLSSINPNKSSFERDMDQTRSRFLTLSST